MPPKGRVAPTAGTNTAGRDIGFHTREFTPEESNFFYTELCFYTYVLEFLG